MKRLAAMLLLCAATPAAADCPTGTFRARAAETGSGLEIGKDGHFRYFLSIGAIDEHAEGIWRCVNGEILLTTQPAPKAAAFRLDKVSDVSGDEAAPFSLIVTWPNGQSVPAVDFRISFATGEPVEGYTQQDGWARDFGDQVPVSVRFAEPFYGTVSAEIAIPARTGIKLHVVLEPNDIGVAAFDGTRVTREGDGDGDGDGERLVLHWRGGELPYFKDD